MRMTTPTRLIFSLFLSALLMACGQKSVKMYPGGELGPESVATIKTSGGLRAIVPNAAEVLVTAINGKPTRFQQTTGEHAFSVLPADYEMHLNLSRKVNTVIAGNAVAKEYSEKKVVKFKALPGKVYKIYGSLYPQDAFPWYAWVEDTSNGFVVAGKKPAKK